MTTSQDVKSFPIDIVLTLLTGVVITKNNLLECASHVLGYSVFIHELPESLDTIHETVCAQHPHLRGLEAFQEGRPDAATYILAYVERQTAKYGATVTLTRGSLTRCEHPRDSFKRLAPHANIEVVTPDLD